MGNIYAFMALFILLTPSVASLEGTEEQISHSQSFCTLQALKQDVGKNQITHKRSYSESDLNLYMTMRKVPHKINVAFRNDIDPPSEADIVWGTESSQDSENFFNIATTGDSEWSLSSLSETDGSEE